MNFLNFNPDKIEMHETEKIVANIRFKGNGYLGVGLSDLTGDEYHIVKKSEVAIGEGEEIMGVIGQRK